LLASKNSDFASGASTNDRLQLPFLTVVIPIYNEEATIRICLESISLQDYPEDRYEILAIDGGSTDETRAIIRNECLPKIGNLRLLDNPKRIQSAALNIGIKAAIGEIIVRLDAHTLAPKRYFKTVAELMKSTGADHLGGIFLTRGSGIWGKSIAAAMSHKFGVGNSLHRTSTSDGINDLGALGAYRKSAFEKYGGFDEELRVCEDCEFGYRVMKAGGIVYRSGKIQFTYFARKSLLRLFKQYYLYGLYKVMLMRKVGSVPKARHVIPLVFVLNLITGIFLTVSGSSFTSIFVSSLLLYIAMALYFAFKASPKGVKYVLPICACFITLHVSYGVGSLTGMASWASNKMRA